MPTVQKTATGKAYYVLNTSVFQNPEFKKGAEFVFHTSAGEAKDLIIYKKKEYVPGYISIVAAEKGHTDKVFTATYAAGRLNGQLYTQSGPTLFLHYDAVKNQNFISSEMEEESRPLSCGLEEEREALIAPGITLHNNPSSGKYKTKATQQRAATASMPYAALDDSVTIDVMLVYTNAAEAWATTTGYGDISGVMAQAMNLSQTALDNSNLNIELRLVHTYKTSYDETTDNVDSDVRLRRITQNTNDPVFDDASYNGYMDDVHTLRDQYGADIVSLLVKIDDTGGLGWRLNSTGGSPAFGFNLDRVQQITNGYTLIHEIGHNMGNAHSRTQKSNAADDGGGLFHYSVGYQNKPQEFHTVMAYGQTADGTYLSEIPMFSSPDLSWQGTPVGTNNITTPENNALSMRQIKRTVSGYRSTIQDAPIASLSSTNIEVEMNREDTQSISVDISNTGASSLVWGVDFDFVSGSVQNKITPKENRTKIEPAKLEQPSTSPANYSGTHLPFRQKAAEVSLYETSFENADGFWGGTYLGRAEWRSLNETEFEISTDHPSDGSQHLRLIYDGGDTKFIASPFFGYHLFGSYEVSIDFSISDVNETYDFYINDGITGNNSSGVIISGGNIYAEDKDETGDTGYYSTGGTVTENAYNTLKIVYNTENESIDYYLNGTLLTQNSYLDGFTPGLIEVLHRNKVLGAYMDVDNITVTQGDSPYAWLSVPDKSGVTFENETGAIGLNFDTEGMVAGTYQTVMKVGTNDPNKPVFEVPITLTVKDAVSNETEERPNQIALQQNYPNPFNPSTTISYTLQKAQQVQLEVFNIQGRKVATLQHGKMSAGSHHLRFDASKLASGIYIYRLKTAEQSLTRQMVLIK
jgi:hypothetical protein